MRRSTLSLVLFVAGVCTACGGRSSLDASSSGAPGAGAAGTGDGGATASAGGTDTGSGGTTASAGGTGATGGATGGAGGASGGTGGTFPDAVWSQQRAGRLSGMAVDGGGHIWLYGGKYSTTGTGVKEWANAHLWKLSPKGDAEIDATYSGGDGFEVSPGTIHADPSGGVLLSGSVSRQPGAATTLTIGGTAISFPFASSAFVVKLDADGKHVWSHVYHAEGPGSEINGGVWSSGIGADAAGRWSLFTDVWGSADLGAGPVSNEGHILVRLSPSGDFLSQLLLPPEEKFSGGTSFALEPSGDMWLSTQHSFQCNYDLHVRRLDPAGSVVAESCMIGACFWGPSDIVPDGAGGVFISDSSDGDYCGLETYLRRVDASGNVLWSLKGTPDLYIPALARTSSGHVMLAGSFRGSFDLGSGPLVSTDEMDGSEVFLADIDASGQLEGWAHYGGPGEQLVVAAGVDPVDARVIAGQLTGTVDFGDGPLSGVSNDPDDAFFVARIPQ